MLYGGKSSTSQPRPVKRLPRVLQCIHHPAGGKDSWSWGESSPSAVRLAEEGRVTICPQGFGLGRPLVICHQASDTRSAQARRCWRMSPERQPSAHGEQRSFWCENRGRHASGIPGPCGFGIMSQNTQNSTFSRWENMILGRLHSQQKRFLDYHFVPNDMGFPHCSYVFWGPFSQNRRTVGNAWSPRPRKIKTAKPSGGILGLLLVILYYIILSLYYIISLSRYTISCYYTKS